MKAQERARIGEMLKWLFVVLIVAVVGAVAFLATWDMPAPSSTIEKTIPNERFQ